MLSENTPAISGTGNPPVRFGGISVQIALPTQKFGLNW